MVMLSQEILSAGHICACIIHVWDLVINHSGFLWCITLLHGCKHMHVDGGGEGQ